MALDEFLVKNDPCRGEFKSSREVTKAELKKFPLSRRTKILQFGSIFQNLFKKEATAEVL